MAAHLAVVFDTGNGKYETKVFTYQPLGLQFRSQLPIIIKRIRAYSQAEELNVQLGWEVCSVGDKRLSGMTIEQASRVFQESVATLRKSIVVRSAPLDAISVKDLSSKLGWPGADVVPYLTQIGFKPKDPRAWEEAASPHLRLGMIDGHRKHSKGKHTWYVIVCKMFSSDASLTQHWQVERRLAHIRALVHDPVKHELGNAYDLYFTGAHFALRGGPAGTSARMGAWLTALSKAINVKALSPCLVASIMRFVEIPLPGHIAEQTLSGSKPV
eukprot:CAMPEP_0172668016 /NCGR_PEP_ID=MMETSP1074-20121228/8802_1 /TAXON_ID=2916 /ORGANISM="Ceratium fusus, Strain PA161109" /LENGTH=270 /DNA_ID=CAMNT_0013484611 /DNA_START=76 /DNA_END=885 /DNA_ORIENTATION=+